MQEKFTPQTMMLKSETESPAMVGQQNANSYYNNSFCQRRIVDIVKDKIDELITRMLDFNNLPLASNTFRLADLGCSTGPNTFFHVQDLIETITKNYQTLCPTSPLPEFQVFFNDQTKNDFNTLFTSLPQDRTYFAAGVPGSFHGRLFPESSLHFVHSSVAIHWLSKVPVELLDKNSPAWNKGRVHYTNAPVEVFNAYASQFGKDMDNFLDARSKELVAGGMMVLVTGGAPDGMLYSELQNGLMFECMDLSLTDMVREGLIEEAQVDTFNVPFYNTSPGQMTKIIEKKGCFSIATMELMDPVPWLKGRINIPEWIMTTRAAMEELFIKQFGREHVDEIFDRLIKKLTEHSDLLESKFRAKTLFLIVLKRK